MSDPRDPQDPYGDRLPPELDPRRGRSARGSRSGRDARSSRDNRDSRESRDGRDSRPARSADSGRPRSRGALPPELDPRRPRSSARSSRDRAAAAPATRPRHRGRIIKIIAAVVSVGVLITSGALWGLYRQVNANVTHIAALPGDAENHGGSGQDIDGS
ncbi:MAG TPA: hypothetical protein VHC49_22440, partial [Mycobacteriales bacterium]|nr:hypothetical protein [Mycobacteriales bacterium]